MNVKEGVAKFNDLHFVAEPGSSNKIVQVECADMLMSTTLKDREKINITYQSQISTSFRTCQHGEVIANGECEVCSTGSYSIGES